MHLLPTIDFKTLDAKFLTSHRFFIGCALCFLLVFVGYDISHVNSVVTTRKALALSDREETIARQTQPSPSQSATGVEPTTTRDPHTRPAESCRVQFAFAGSKYDYGQFPTLKSWIRYTDPKCAIDFLRSNHPFMTQLTAAQSRMYYESDYLPILQADMLKMFSVYYLGGVAVDLDVEALKPFPSEWTGPNTTLATCDVVLGIEADCYDDICVKSMRRKGQIQNWVMYARRPRSTFLGELLDFTVDRYERFYVPHGPNATVEVQEIAGSGVITDFVQLYGNFSQPHYLNETSPGGPSLMSDKGSVLRIKKYNEEVCIVGSRYTGGGCSRWSECLVDHHFEGSWKKSSL